MLNPISNTPHPANRQSRRRLRPGLAQRAVAAVKLVTQRGWSQRTAAVVFGVSQGYISVVRRASTADRRRLARGEISLAELYRGRYRRQRPVPGREQSVADPVLAKWLAWRQRSEAENAVAVDDFMVSIGPDRVLERIVAKFGPEPLMASLDAVTKPTLVAAE